jgi:hypothetical protein
MAEENIGINAANVKTIPSVKNGAISNPSHNGGKTIDMMIITETRTDNHDVLEASLSAMDPNHARWLYIHHCRQERKEVPGIDNLVFQQKKSENWVPACGGTEVPFMTRNRRKLLYCWNTFTGDHAYLDCETDLILSDEEARAFLGV